MIGRYTARLKTRSNNLASMVLTRIIGLDALKKGVHRDPGGVGPMNQKGRPGFAL